MGQIAEGTEDLVLSEGGKGRTPEYNSERRVLQGLEYS